MVQENIQILRENPFKIDGIYHDIDLRDAKPI